MEHLRYFETTAAFEEAKSNFNLPNVSYIVETETVYYKSELITPPDDEIWYTTTDRQLIKLMADEEDGYETIRYEVKGAGAIPYFGASLLSNTYEKGKGVLKFNGPVTKILATDINSLFYPVENLMSINIPDSVTNIGRYAFKSCSSLTSVTISNSVTRIEDSAFVVCTSLTGITIPDSVTRIGGYAFSRCSGLTNVTIGNSVTNIDSFAFAGCTSFTGITIPNSVTSIGYGTFYNCKSLTSVNYTGTKQQWNNIYKGEESFSNTMVTVVHCSDGDVSI